MKHCRYLPYGMIEAALHLSNALGFGEHTARFVNHSHRNLGAANVNPADHVAFPEVKCFIKTNEY
jgi:hypothetical protein